ncbi:MAG: N-6 DNA methylase [Planctomycetaceae bacterium]|jgi:type I restriction-modification system DNA methylase subunit|nr:N-6 DNA methylase [Planctomycetaceae bacterium]
MHDPLRSLIDIFRSNIAQYKSSEYDEANTRTDFIDKFFTLIGWDVNNSNGYSEQYRDVVREDHIQIDNRPKAPDYSFRIAGSRKFFVEAKKPSVNIRDEIAPAFQLRRYGYTAKLPLSILTDFEEFAVYDTRIKPHKNDKASAARIFYCRFDQYLEKCSFEGFGTNFDYIFGTFSKEAILKGSFDRYIEASRNKKGTGEVDQDLLALVEDWRLILARNIAKFNPGLDQHNLNVAVQRIIDRILFLRIAEDRRIEQYGKLLNAAKNKGIYRELQKIFEVADDKYNAGLFKQEDWLDRLTVPDKVLTDIVTGLYYPESPYEFSVLPIEILGSIYERFLGKTIRLTASHSAAVEEKPEVRKAGGVYYTPQYIVDYIIRETVGTKLRPPLFTLHSSLLTILDPACGSGSFLVGAYTFLLDYYLSYYTEPLNIKKALKSGVIYESGYLSYRLSIDEKQRLLLNSIYGVDIDPIAAEVTKLSLYLKLLEHETEESHPALFSRKYLPNLDANIRCGNSLVGSDFYLGKQMSLFDDDALRKVNAFDWHKEFPHIFSEHGGFDIVVGNPPWGQKAAKFSDDEKAYFAQKYPAASVGILDLFRLFVEKSIHLIKDKGFWGQVLPDIILLKNYETTRRQLLETMTLKTIDHWGTPFQQVNLEVCTITGIKGSHNGRRKIQIAIHKKNDDEVIKNAVQQSIFSELPGSKFNILLTDASLDILKKLWAKPQLNEFFDVHEGIHSGNVRKKLFVDKKLNRQCKKLIFGRDEVQRYFLKWDGMWVHYTKDFFKKNDYAGLGKPEYFETKKLVIRRTGDYVLACLDDVGYYFSNNVFVCIPCDTAIDLRFFLALLNSRLMTWYYRNAHPQVGQLFPEIKINLINDFPVPPMNLSDKKMKQRHARLVDLAEQMLAAQTKLRSAISDSDRRLHEQRILILDREIDTIVYELYGLTAEEIKIVEGK